MGELTFLWRQEQPEMLQSAWTYRNFIAASIAGELKGRYARSTLGAAWFILHPLAQAAILSLVLAEVLSAKMPGVVSKSGYAIYVMSGVAAWSLFSEIVTRSTGIFVEYSSALKKIAFPRICLPIVVGGTALFTHALLLVAVCIVLVALGHWPAWSWLALPLGMLVIAAFGFGLGLILGTFNVFSRDVAFLLTVVLQFWYWLTPIVYSTDMVPQRLQSLLALNPMTALVNLYHDVIFRGIWPAWSSLAYPVAAAVALLLVALFVFRRASAELVDAL